MRFAGIKLSNYMTGGIDAQKMGQVGIQGSSLDRMGEFNAMARGQGAKYGANSIIEQAEAGAETTRLQGSLDREAGIISGISSAAGSIGSGIIKRNQNRQQDTPDTTDYMNLDLDYWNKTGGQDYSYDNFMSLGSTFKI